MGDLKQGQPYHSMNRPQALFLDGHTFRPGNSHLETDRVSVTPIAKRYLAPPHSRCHPNANAVASGGRT